MALTKVLAPEREVRGNQNYQTYVLTFSSVTSGTFDTGLASVESAFYVPTTSDKHGVVVKNSNDGVRDSSPGSIYISGVTADDIGDLYVHGR